MLTPAHTLPDFTTLRKMIQLAAYECDAEVSNRRSKVLAQALINQHMPEADHRPDNYRPYAHLDPVGEKVVRRVMAMLGGHVPEATG